jgi:hypothetical protein
MSPRDVPDKKVIKLGKESKTPELPTMRIKRGEDPCNLLGADGLQAGTPGSKTPTKIKQRCDVATEALMREVASVLDNITTQK